MFVTDDPSTDKTYEMDPRRSSRARKAVPRNAFDSLLKDLHDARSVKKQKLHETVIQDRREENE